MNDENKEIINEEEVKNESEKVEEVVTSQTKKKKKSGILIPILAAVIAFVVVYGGITLVNHLNAKDDVVDKEESKNGSTEVEDNVEEDSSTNTSSDEESVSENVGGTTGPDEVITITDDMKTELNRIAFINDSYCYVEKLFYNMNGFTKDLTTENKKYIIMNYYLLTHNGSNSISETAFKEIAGKYSFTESFDTIMAGFEKVGNEYVIPPMGCVGPEKVTHNATYHDAGNTIAVIDNVTITNTESSEVTNIKVTYTFIYSKDNNNNITFKLYSVNSVK